MTYEWDEVKAQLNIAKHGVSFDEATTVFCDDMVLSFLMKNIQTMKRDFTCWE